MSFYSKEKLFRQLSTFAQVFFCVLVVTALHRSIAVAIHYKKIDFKYTYNPAEGFNQYQTYLSQFGESIANGLRADLQFSLLLGALLFVLPRGLRIFCIAALVLFYAANLEHIRYNMTSIDLGLVGLGADATFVVAQLTKQFMLFSLILVVAAAVALCSQYFRIGRWFSLAIAFMALPLSIIPVFSLNISQPFWLQSHPLVPILRHASVVANNREFPDSVLTHASYDFYDESEPTRNLLLIYMEGLSYLSIENGRMDYLASLADSAIDMQRYFGPQLITANGLYSTLTGRLPRFVSTDLRWDDIPDGDAVVFENSLPVKLKAHGYQTSFVQAAPLAYMNKDEILPILGFDNLIGDEAHPASQPRGGWGVDDRSLFENVVTQIDSLDQSRPWMVGVLTTGTHSPYFVPDDYLPDEQNDRYRALRYADDALEYLIESLRSRGMLDDTVVVITADESREISGAGSLQDEVALNWLPMVILEPDRSKVEVTDYVVSPDVPQLVWGLLDKRKHEFKVQRHSKIVFGNITSGRVLWYDVQHEELLACENKQFACGLYGDVTDLSDLSNIKPIEQAYFPNLKKLMLEFDEGPINE